MRYEVVLSPEAVDDLRGLKAAARAVVLDAIEEHLRQEPTRTSRRRIKRLRGLSRPQYRLREETVRTFYDVIENVVEVLAIVPKDDAAKWLEEAGEQHEDRGPE